MRSFRIVDQDVELTLARANKTTRPFDVDARATERIRCPKQRSGPVENAYGQIGRHWYLVLVVGVIAVFFLAPSRIRVTDAEEIASTGAELKAPAEA